LTDGKSREAAAVATGELAVFGTASTNVARYLLECSKRCGVEVQSMRMTPAGTGPARVLPVDIIVRCNSTESLVQFLEETGKDPAVACELKRLDFFVTAREVPVRFVFSQNGMRAPGRGP
jgi:hypothetical protein